MSQYDGNHYSIYQLENGVGIFSFLLNGTKFGDGDIYKVTTRTLTNAENDSALTKHTIKVVSVS